MYKQEDFQSISAQLKKRSLMLLIPTVLLAGFFTYGFIMHLNRNESLQWLSYVSLLIAGLMLLFCDGLFIAPLRAYKHYLQDALFGRTRETTGYFKSIDHTPCVCDNVTFYSLILSDGNMNKEEDDRLFYFDAEKTFPAIHVGDKVTITSTDKRIANIVHV